MERPPNIDDSTVEERREYIKKRFPCLANCDMCGLCKVYYSQDGENAYHEYIIGKRSFADISGDYR